MLCERDDASLCVGHICDVRPCMALPAAPLVPLLFSHPPSIVPTEPSPTPPPHPARGAAAQPRYIRSTNVGLTGAAGRVRDYFLVVRMESGVAAYLQWLDGRRAAFLLPLFFL